MLAVLAVSRLVRVQRGLAPHPEGKARLPFILAFLLLPPIVVEVVVLRPATSATQLHIVESILLYLGDRFPEVRLAPVERADYYRWLVFMTNTLQTTMLRFDLRLVAPAGKQFRTSCMNPCKPENAPGLFRSTSRPGFARPFSSSPPGWGRCSEPGQEGEGSH